MTYFHEAFQKHTPLINFSNRIWIKEITTSYITEKDNMKLKSTVLMYMKFICKNGSVFIIMLFLLDIQLANKNMIYENV